MTQKSYFYDGASAGDAKYAPYKAEVFAGLMNAMEGDRVLHLNNLLEVTPSANMVLQVDTGAAIIAGVYCGNSPADTVTIATANPDLPRIDRVIIRIDWDAATPVYLDVKNGTPSEFPEPPELVTLVGDVYEFSLARVYVSAGLAAITTSHIIDERVIDTHPDYTPHNMMVNSNFVSPVGTGSKGGVPNWLVGSVPILTQANKFGGVQPSGTTVQVEFTAGDLDYIETILNVSNTDNVPVVIHMLVQVSEGELWIDTAGGAVTGYRIPQSENPVKVIIRKTQSGDITLRIKNASATNRVIARVGSITFTYGYVPAEFSKIREFVIFENQIVLNENTAGIAGTTQFNIPDYITDDVESIYVQTKGQGTLTGGNVVFINYRDLVTNDSIVNLRLDNQRNNRYLITQGWLTNQDGLIGLDFTIGGGAVTYSTYLLGIYT